MFAGRRFDIEISLYYSRARYYNPYTGRFLQTDPIGYGDGTNMYAYCGNSPTGFLDPFGLDTIENTVYGEATDGVWKYIMVSDCVYALSGVWDMGELSTPGECHNNSLIF